METPVADRRRWGTSALVVLLALGTLTAYVVVSVVGRADAEAACASGPEAVFDARYDLIVWTWGDATDADRRVITSTLDDRADDVRHLDADEATAAIQAHYRNSLGLHDDSWFGPLYLVDLDDRDDATAVQRELDRLDEVRAAVIQCTDVDQPEVSSDVSRDPTRDAFVYVHRDHPNVLLRLGELFEDPRVAGSEHQPVGTREGTVEESAVMDVVQIDLVDWRDKAWIVDQLTRISGTGYVAATPKCRPTRPG